MKFNKFILLSLLIFLSTSVFSQNIDKVLKKPYQDWDTKEATKILSDSPWAIEYQSSKGLALTSQREGVRAQSDNRLGGSERGRVEGISQPAPIVIRLHSALPVREAIARLQQLNAGYDKMKGDDKKRYDEATKEFLECKICQNFYVVTLTKFKDSSFGVVDDGLFQSMKFEDFKGKVWLTNDDDVKLEVAGFSPPNGAGDSAVFFFKRMGDKSTPFLTSKSKNLKFLFSSELLNNNNNYSSLLPRSFDFKVSKLVIDDKVAF